MPSTNLSGSNIFDPDLEEQTPAQDIMTEGIMQIAGGIETVVQQLQLQVVLWCLSLMPGMIVMSCMCCIEALVQQLQLQLPQCRS